MFPQPWHLRLSGDSPEPEVVPEHAPEKYNAESDNKKIPHGKRLFSEKSEDQGTSDAVERGWLAETAYQLDFGDID